MLKVEQLVTCYGRVRALAGVSLDVERGEIVTLVGSNGAGKSTTLMTICGVLTPTEGSISFEGRKIAGLLPHEIARLGVVQVPEGRGILRDMTVAENLDLGGFTRTAEERRTSIARVYEMLPRLAERRSQLGGTLSGGEQQMLAIGRALIAQPRLLILDEPSLGLAPRIIEQIFELIRDLKKGGTTILLVEQNAAMALEIADRGYVLETGAIVASGSAAALRLDDGVRRAYLGI
jgi:branched-chain amino acid transport system ATP-binding protein